MAKFSTPAPKKKYPIEIENFLGADLSNAPNNVEKNRSPSCPNMIRDTVGKVRKRDGITLVKSYPSKINGVHFLYGATTKKLVHSGTSIWLDGVTPTELYTTANNHISVSTQINGKLYILDGLKFLVFDGTTIVPVVGKIPVIIIARTPTGGGTVLEAINLIQPKRTEKYAGTAGATVYQLTATMLDADAVVIKKLKSDGTFDTLVEGTHFTVNRTLGQITFSTAPGVSPLTGEDNIHITYAKTVTGYADRVNKCDISILYGMSGSRDRLFVSGNPTLPNYDYYCGINDPTYFGDLSYSVIGQDSSRIMNYSIVNDYLVTHKDNAENDNNTNLRKGSLVDNKAVFTSQGSYQASGALSKHSFANLQNEPLYVTKDKNISAITPSDVLGERFSQERSYYITKALEKEDLTNSFAYTFDGLYFLATGSNIYVLDGLQYSVERNRPYSTRQYECYYFPNVSSTVMWEENGELYFGTADGKIKKFDKASSNDEGLPIMAYWDTPELDGGSFADKKTFVYVGTRLASAVSTAVKISVKVQGIWRLAVDYNNEAKYLDFDHVDFDNISFSTDTSPHTLGSKLKEKNVDKIQFRFENSRLGEPFGIYRANFEYTEGNKYRK